MLTNTDAKTMREAGGEDEALVRHQLVEEIDRLCEGALDMLDNHQIAEILRTLAQGWEFAV